MRHLAAREAKTRFGELLDLAQREPVAIEKHGRRVAVMMSVQDFDELEALKQDHLRRELAEGLADLEAGRSVDGEAYFEALLRDDSD